MVSTGPLSTVPKDNSNLGNYGEVLAKAFLNKNGYKVLACNYKNRIGEIDIVAEDKGVICFVEVKTRGNCGFGLPQEAVLSSKQRKISLTALKFLKDNNLLETNSRFDVVSVLIESQGPKIELIKNAFEFNLQPRY